MDTQNITPLQPKLQHVVGITEQLKTAGGSMTKRRLFNNRRRGCRNHGDQRQTYRWHIALRQLLDNRVVKQAGSGRRGDPIVISLLGEDVSKLPENANQTTQRDGVRS